MLDKGATAAEVTAFMNRRHLPGRLNAFETGQILGFEEHDIPTLVKAKVLRPLGNPSRNAHKFFALKSVLSYRDDDRWLSKATELVSIKWQDKNRRKKSGGSN